MSVQVIGREQALEPLKSELRKSANQHSSWYYILGHSGTGKTLVLHDLQTYARRISASDSKSPLCVLLDFQSPEILFVEGLLDAIVTGLRSELQDDTQYFTDYDNALARLIQARRDYLMPASYEKLSAQVYEAFRDDYYNLVKKYRVMLLFDTMEQFDKEFLLLDNEAVREFFRDKILPLHGTVFVLAGRSHHDSDSQENSGMIEYRWHSNGILGIYPGIYTPPEQDPEPVNNKKIYRFVFSDFNLSHIRRFLWTKWDWLSTEEKQQRIDEELLPYISKGEELADNALADVLKNPLLLTLFAEHYTQTPYFNKKNLLLSRQDIEFMLVQRYYDLGGLSDVIMYAALKDYGFDEQDLASIMRIDNLSARQKLKALRNRDFVKQNPNGTFSLHDEMRYLIKTHIWDAYDPIHEQRYAIYRILLDRYAEELIKLQKSLAEKIRGLQKEPIISQYDILNHSLDSPKVALLEDLALVVDISDENWGYHLPVEPKGLISFKEKRQNRQLIQIWMDIQELARRERIIVQDMRQMVNRLGLCSNFEREIRVFEQEWYLAEQYRPNLLQSFIDGMIAKMQDCEFWEMTDSFSETRQPYLRDFNFRVVTLFGRNLEYEKRYEEASAFYAEWLDKLAERNGIDDIQRRIILLTAQARALLHHPKGLLDKANDLFTEVLALCHDYPGVAQSRAFVESQIAYLYQLQNRFAEALERYDSSTRLLQKEKNGQRVRTILMLNFVQSGYVQRYSNPQVGIELAHIGLTFLERERLDAETAMALRTLVVLHRRNGDYEESFRYGIQAYKLAHQIQNVDIATLAEIELAITRWYAVANVRGTDAKQNYTTETVISAQQNASMEWTVQHLEDAYKRMDGQCDDYAMNLEFLRLNHLMIRVAIEIHDEDKARHYLARAKEFSEVVKGFFRSQQLLFDELLLEYNFDSTLTYLGFINLPAYKLLMHNARQLLSSYFVGNAHHLAGRIAQRMAILTADMELFDKAIEHYMQAYVYLAKQPNLGTLNTGQDWRLLEDRIRDLELTELPQARTVILDWCARVEKALNSYDPNWQTVVASYPQLPRLVKVIQIRQHLMTLQMKPVLEEADIYKQVDTYIARRQYAPAWRIIMKHQDDLRMLLRKVEILTALERTIAAVQEFKLLQAAVNFIQLSEEEDHRLWIQQAVLWAYYNDPSHEYSNLQIMLATMLGTLDKIDVDEHPDIAAETNYRFGDILQHMGYYYPALHYFEVAVQLYVQLENPIAAADCLLRLSRLHSLVGNYELGIWYADQGTFFMDKLEHDEGIVEGYTALGIGYRAWAVYAGLRGAPGTLLQHYQQARYYLDSATKQAELRGCQRLIPEIMKELSLTLRYESNLVIHNTPAYEGILEESQRYLDEATRRYENRPERKISPRQLAELYQLRGHVYRKLASMQINKNQDKRQALVEIAFEKFNEALKYGKQSNDYVTIAGTYLTLIEMLYVNSWADPKPTSQYHSLALQFQHETNLYQHFSKHDTQFNEFHNLGEDFKKISDDLINRLHQTLEADELFKIPDGLRHYFGRIEMIFANVAFWGGNSELAIGHCSNAARYFARSSRAVYNVKHMLRQIRYFLDGNVTMSNNMAEQLLANWEGDSKIKEIYPDLLALCRAYSYIQKYIESSYEPDEEDFEFDSV